MMRGFRCEYRRRRRSTSGPDRPLRSRSSFQHFFATEPVESGSLASLVGRVEDVLDATLEISGEREREFE